MDWTGSGSWSLLNSGSTEPLDLLPRVSQSII